MFSFQDQLYPDWITYHDIDKAYRTRGRYTNRQSMPLETNPMFNSVMIAPSLQSNAYTASVQHDRTGVWYSDFISWFENGDIHFKLSLNAERFLANRIARLLPIDISREGENRIVIVPRSRTENNDWAFKVNQRHQVDLEDGTVVLRHGNADSFNCIVGKFQCPLRIDPAWITDEYRRLVRVGTPMSVLADALVANGCDNEELISLVRRDCEQGISLSRDTNFRRRLVMEAKHRMIAAGLDDDDLGEFKGVSGNLFETGRDVLGGHSLASVIESEIRNIGYTTSWAMRQRQHDSSRGIAYVELSTPHSTAMVLGSDNARLSGNYAESAAAIVERELGWPYIAGQFRVYYALVDLGTDRIPWVPFPRGIGPKYFRKLFNS